MFCPKCGAKNEDSSNFCNNCSQPLSAFRSAEGVSTASPSAPQSTVNQAAPVAPAAPAAPSNLAAPSVGAPPAVHAATTTPLKKRGMPAWLIGILSGLALLVAFFVWAALSPDDSSASDRSDASSKKPGKTIETTAGAEDEESDADDESADPDVESESDEDVVSDEDPAAGDEAVPDEEAASDNDAVADEDSASDEESAPDEGALAAEDMQVVEAEMADYIKKDIFDWQMMSDDEKRELMLHFQDIWALYDVTGAPLTSTPDELVTLISENLSEQAVIFWVACEQFNIDPNPYYEAASAAE